MVRVPATGNVEVSIFSNAVTQGHISIGLVVRTRWPRPPRDMKGIDSPSPHFLVIIRAVEDDIPIIMFTVNKRSTEILVYQQALDESGNH